MLRYLLRSPEQAEPVRTLYGIIVKAARSPFLYRDCGVPDSLDGRFELLVLHMHLVLRRLRGAPPPAARFAQSLFDTMFDDMDVDLREMGAGDMGVGRKVKAMAQAFYGRAAAYDSALDREAAALSQALERNLYATAAPEPDQVDRLVRYVKAQVEHLQEVPVNKILSAEFAFREIVP